MAPYLHTRREALRHLGLAAAGAMLPACSLGDGGSGPTYFGPRLSARPGLPQTFEANGTIIFQAGGSDAVVHVPESVDRSQPTGLLVFLHGALRTVEFFVEGHRPWADAAGVIFLAPYAGGGGTWDAIHGGIFSRDIGVIDQSLLWVFRRWRIDPNRVVLSGFSDGGTYSLAVGRANGDLFRKVVAYSPGFLLDVDPVGMPPILVSHGIEDQVLPVDGTSRIIVPQLMELGYTVDYREFHGPHAVPGDVAEEVVSALGPG